MTDQAPADGVTPPSDPGAFHPYTLPEAARRLGVGQSTVRRMVKAGRLRAEAVLRPQGTAWVVYLPDVPSTADVEAPDHPPPSGGSARSTDPPQAPAPSAPDALATWVVTLMAPLAEANARQHDTIVSQAERLEAQAEIIGQLTEQVDGRHRELLRSVAELERARAEAQNFAAEQDAAESSRRREARRLRITVALAAMLAVVGVLASSWVR